MEWVMEEGNHRYQPQPMTVTETGTIDTQMLVMCVYKPFVFSLLYLLNIL